MRLLFASLAGFALLFGAACSDDDPSGSTGPDGDRKIVDAPIESIEILVRESAPPGYTAQIVSGLPSGCAKFRAAEVLERTGTNIAIRVTNTIPADPGVACTAIYGTYESNVNLGQDFVSGTTYTVQVNEKRKTFVAQ